MGLEEERTGASKRILRQGLLDRSSLSMGDAVLE